MLMIGSQTRIFVAIEPIDFRSGIDRLAQTVRTLMAENPMSGAVFVFRNRSGTGIKLLMYDGQGFWLCYKRLSQGKFDWWPSKNNAYRPLALRELQVLLWNGDPDQAAMPCDWRSVA